jgi:hypothetical protein
LRPTDESSRTNYVRKGRRSDPSRVGGSSLDARSYFWPLKEHTATIVRGIGMAVLTGAALRSVGNSSTNATFVSTFEWSFILLVVIFATLQGYGVYTILKKSPIPKGVAWGHGLRQAFLATGRTHERWWANHPWWMFLVTIAIAMFGAIAVGARAAFYTRPS